MKKLVLLLALCGLFCQGILFAQSYGFDVMQGNIPSSGSLSLGTITLSETSDDDFDLSADNSDSVHAVILYAPNGTAFNDLGSISASGNDITSTSIISTGLDVNGDPISITEIEYSFTVDTILSQDVISITSIELVADNSHSGSILNTQYAVKLNANGARRNKAHEFLFI